MRLDKWLIQSLAFKSKISSRAKAQNLIKDGAISVNNKIITDVSYEVQETDNVTLNESKQDHYVSRSAHKLVAALDFFKFDVSNLLALDVGISTGGFTQVLLERGASEVVGIDVGHGQLHPSLKNNPQITLFEGINAKEDFSLPHQFDLIVVDVSFISVLKILDNVLKFLKLSGTLFILIKPQFEQGYEADKKLILSDKKSQEIADRTISDIMKKYNCFKSLVLYKVPMKGKEGNQEYFVRCQK